jgi:hypothetical protein
MTAVDSYSFEHEKNVQIWHCSEVVGGSNPTQSTNYMGSNTAASYFLYETIYAVNISTVDRNYEEEQLWRFEY